MSSFDSGQSVALRWSTGAVCGAGRRDHVRLEPQIAIDNHEHAVASAPAGLVSYSARYSSRRARWHVVARARR